MQIKEVRIKGYRRFTDLTVVEIPPEARLIVLVGPNGTGKSSFFDALVTISQVKAPEHGVSWDTLYHSRSGVQYRGRQNEPSPVEADFHDAPRPAENKLVYARSAYRVEAAFEITQIQRQQDPLAQPRSGRMIDVDASVSRNYQRLCSRIMAEASKRTTNLKPEEAYDRIVAEVQSPLSRLFDDLIFEGIGDFEERGTFEFTKGTVQRFNFMNLSGGEKAAFDLILDLVLASKKYNDTLYCIDEPESHLHARLQADLLDVLYDLVKPNGQLMIATHSIGMIRRALDLQREDHGSVCFLDFGERDFDKPQVMKPIQPSRAFFKKAHDVAIGDVAALVAPSTVVICEGTPLGSTGVTHDSVDAKCFRTIFESEFGNTDFVSMGNDKEVIKDRYELAATLQQFLGATTIVRVVDGDQRGPTERAELEAAGVRVLSRRNLEHYMYDDEVLTHLALEHADAESDTLTELLTRKREIIDELAKEHQGDVKKARGHIYSACKSLLNLRNCGNNPTSFMYETLAHHMKPDMSVYEELKMDIFG